MGYEGVSESGSRGIKYNRTAIFGLNVAELVAYSGLNSFPVCTSFSHASLLNVAEVSRECEVSRKTVEGYVSVLEDMLLGNRLPVFSRRAKRTLIKQSKFYFSDCGVFRSVRPKGPLDRPEEMDGAALEGLVYQHLKAWSDYSTG